MDRINQNLLSPQPPQLADPLVFLPLKVPSGVDQQRLLRWRPFVRQSGDHRRARWVIRERRSLDYMLMYIAAGEGVFTVENHPYLVGPGSIFWVPPNRIHDLRATTPEIHRLFLHFDLLYDPGRSHWNLESRRTDLTGLEHLLHPPVDDPLIDSWCGRLDLKCNRREFHQLLRMICHCHATSADAGLKLSGMMLELLAMMIAGASEENELPAASAKMADVIFYLQYNLRENLPIRQLARKFGLSESHFRRQFVAAFGQSPREMIQTFRINNGCEFLTRSSLNISEIADATGFGSIYSFSRAFRRGKGMSPSEYRARYS